MDNLFSTAAAAVVELTAEIISTQSDNSSDNMEEHHDDNIAEKSNSGNNDTLPLNSTKTSARVPLPVSYQHIGFLVVLFVAIFVCNLSLLLAILTSKTGKRSRMIFFITNLAFTGFTVRCILLLLLDLCVAFFSVLVDLIWKLTVHWYAGAIMCRVVRFLQAVVTYASTYVLVALSIDRFDAIARPMSFSGGDLRAKVLIGLAWSIAGLFSLPMLIFNKTTTDPDGTTRCRMVLGSPHYWQIYMSLVSISVFIIPTLIIVVCYVVIIYVIWTKSKIISVGSSSSPTRKSIPSSRSFFRARQVEGESIQITSTSRSVTRTSRGASASSRGVIPQAKIRTVKMTFVIVLVFILCWSPYFVFDLLHVFNLLPKGPQTSKILMFIQSLAPLNSVTNPIIYGIFSTKICQNLRRVGCAQWLWTTLCCCFNSLLRRHFTRRDRSASMDMSATSSYGPVNNANHDGSPFSCSLAPSPCGRQRIGGAGGGHPAIEVSERREVNRLNIHRPTMTSTVAVSSDVGLT